MKLPDHVHFLSVDQTVNTLRKNVRLNLQSHSIAASSAMNLVTAADHAAKRDIPDSDNSAMDGYLFLKSDLESGIRTFQVDGEIRPETDEMPELKPKSSLAIMTGAPVPKKDVVVVPVEEVREKNGVVEVLNIPKRNPIRKQGEGYKKGKVVVNSGTLIRPYEIGLLIESGNHTCSVFKPIRIAIQVTGSEIDEDKDSNGPVLSSLISEWPGVEVKRYPVLKDDPDAVTARLQELKRESDVVITTGGISAGKHDYILESMAGLGAEVLVRKVLQKPGKPFTVTKLNDTPFFHLPGNPISAVFTAEFYVRTVLLHQLGLSLPTFKAVTTTAMGNHRSDKTLFLTGRLQHDEEQTLTVTTEGKMRSHLMQLYRGNNCYVRLDTETAYSSGDKVEVIPFTVSGYLPGF